MFGKERKNYIERLPRSYDLFLLFFLALGHSEFYCSALVASVIPHNNAVFALIPEILNGKLSGAAETLNVTNTLQGAFQMFVKSFNSANLSECELHRNGIGAYHRTRIDGKDIIVIIGLNEVGARHNFARFVERNLRQNVTSLGVVGLFHLLLTIHQCLGQDHGSGLDAILVYRNNPPELMGSPG